LAGKKAGYKTRKTVTNLKATVKYSLRKQIQKRREIKSVSPKINPRLEKYKKILRTKKVQRTKVG